MTVLSEVNRNGYLGNGVATVFAYSFKVNAATELRVVLTDVNGDDSVLVNNVDYTVSGVLNASGGNVTLVTAPEGDGSAWPASEILTIRRVLPVTQLTDLRTQGAFSAEVLERAIDRTVMIEQQLKDQLDRSLRVPETEAGSDSLILPMASDRAGNGIMFGASGEVIVGSPADSPVSAAMQPVVAATTKDSAATLFTYNATGGSTARSMAARAADTVCVLDYGADITGATDSTASIIAAIGTGNRRVYFPPGTYKIGTSGASDGINILYSDVELVFAPGAVLVKYGTGGCITLARAASTTINRIRINGARITSADTSSANAGIVIAPDATNAAHYVTIENCVITSMGQYGIVQASASGGANYLTISNTLILTNGALTGAITRQALILNPSVGSASHDLTISNVYVEQINDTGASPESDGCKIQNFTGVSITNYTVKCSGSAAVMSTLVLNNNTNLVAANLRVICGGSTGLQIDSSATGIHEITNVVITGTIGGNNAVYLATSGSNKMSLRGIHTAGAFAGIGTHERLEVSDSVIDLGIDLSSATVNNSVIRGNTCRAAIYLVGANNIIRNNISISSSTYAVRVNGNANFIDGNYAFTPTNGHVQIVGGTSSLIGTMHGNDVSIVDAGTTTKRSIANVPLGFSVGTYTAAATTPDVTGINFMVIANAGAVTITNFTGGVVGQILVLKFSDANTTVNRTNAALAGGANFVSTADDILVLVKGAALWHEIARAANS